MIVALAVTGLICGCLLAALLVAFDIYLRQRR